VTLDLVGTLSQLVEIPSVNPMGAAVSGREFYEADLTDHLESLFEQLRLPHQRQMVEPGRENLIVRLDGQPPPDKGGGLILFDAHQDTVPVVGMTIDPWTPRISDGRLYGRGSCDTKGGMAAMLGAIAQLAEDRPAAMPTIVMACTVNEEYGFSGAAALEKIWTGQPGTGLSDRIIPRKPDAAVVAEPTGLDVVVAHKHGRAAHGAQPETGDNAIYKMARVVSALQRYQQNVVGRLGTHRLCGPGSLCLGTIHGGTSVNTVPDRCTIEIDRRLRPGEDPDKAYCHLVDYLRQVDEIDFPLELPPAYMQGLPLSDESNGPLADRLTAVAREVVSDCSQSGVAYATNAALFSQPCSPRQGFTPWFSAPVPSTRTTPWTNGYSWTNWSRTPRSSTALFAQDCLKTALSRAATRRREARGEWLPLLGPQAGRWPSTAGGGHGSRVTTASRTADFCRGLRYPIQNVSRMKWCPE